MSELFKVVREVEEDNNDPELCSICANVNRWPNCMKNITVRGYHSVFEVSNYFDVTSCDNHECCPRNN